MQKTVTLNVFQLATILLGAALLVLLVSNRSLQNKINLTTSKFASATISVSSLKQMLTTKVLPDGKQAFFLVNVHTPYEGEIEKTDAFIKFDEISKNLDKLPKDKTTKIILYCKTDRMSETALKKLTELGYTNVFHLQGGMDAWQKAGNKTFNVEELKKLVLPEKGIAAPVKWGNLGPTLVSLEVIDLAKFKQTVQPKAEELTLLNQESDQPITINSNNAQFVVDVLWAVGLAQKSKVYSEGPMGKDYKKEIGNFASTGGWTLAKTNAVNYLGKYEIVKLTPEQDDKVYEIARNVFRPCCGNPTSFPDCNHGMAALGLIELMVAKGYSDAEIYRTVLGFNSFWFPQTYVSLAAYFSNQGITWDKVDGKEALSQKFSSGQGAAKISQEVGPLPYLFGTKAGGCGA